MIINSFLYHDPVILRSLKKSRVRIQILTYLYKISPSVSYPHEIARRIRVDPSNVIGGLRGMGNRYNGNSSLIEMGLVEAIETNGDIYYRLTDLGKKIMNHMNSEEYDRSRT
jgi:predicted transcriptional regulator with HTH domain